MTIKLYFANHTRATRPRWLLEELSVPYEIVKLDLKAKQHKEPAYLAVHPHGVVPAAEIDGRTVIESGAIVATLADLFLDKGFAPKPDSPERGAYFQWLFYAQATVEPAVVAMANPDDAAKARWAEILALLSKNLDKKDWMMGQRFTAVDCVMGSLLIWAASMKLTEGAPLVSAYVDRCRARPAYQRARKDPA